jgi:hypothetical protein
MATTIERHDAPQKEVPEWRAKQGVAFGHMRYVLGVSLLLAVVAGVFLYLAFFY